MISLMEQVSYPACMDLVRPGFLFSVPQSSMDLGEGFWPAFFKSLSMIIVTELGDKTFFIAAVLAMRYDRLLVFGGAIGKL